MTDQEIFAYWQYALPLLNNLLAIDVGVSLTDREKYLLYKPGNEMTLNVHVGDLLKPGSTVYRAIHEQKRIVQQVPTEMFGQPFIAVAVPVYNDRREVIGAVCVQETVTRQEQLKNAAAALASNISVMISTTQEVAAQAQEITSVCQVLETKSEESVGRMKETDQVLRLIRTITDQTNLLGLNAAIEAARVGEMGKGFGVVAQEIRKLATSSADSIKKIEGIIQAIQSDSQGHYVQIQQMHRGITQIAEAMSSVAGSIEELGHTAAKVDEMAQNRE